MTIKGDIGDENDVIDKKDDDGVGPSASANVDLLFIPVPLNSMGNKRPWCVH